MTVRRPQLRFLGVPLASKIHEVESQASDIQETRVATLGQRLGIPHGLIRLKGATRHLEVSLPRTFYLLSVERLRPTSPTVGDIVVVPHRQARGSGQ